MNKSEILVKRYYYEYRIVRHGEVELYGAQCRKEGSSEWVFLTEEAIGTYGYDSKIYREEKHYFDKKDKAVELIIDHRKKNSYYILETYGFRD